MSHDPIEKSRLAFLGARYRFEMLLKGEPTDDEYRKAKADLDQAKQRYDQLTARNATTTR